MNLKPAIIKALKIIAIILPTLLATGGIVVFLQPEHGHVEQSIVVNAPPEVVYPEINGYISFNEWSPWKRVDPEATYSFEGPEAGVGAKMTWEGKKLRKGAQWIEESVKNRKVKNALTYDGSDGTAYSEFILTPLGGGTVITWNFDCINVRITGKLKWVLFEILINDMYTQGLLDLKRHVENIEAKAHPSTP